MQRGDRVGVCLPNNWAAVVSIFGVLKAGAVFVPINPGVKPEKLRYILNNCRAAAVILDDRPASWRRVIHSRDFPAIEREFPAQRPPAVNIDLDLACLIYTSGSTGEPKGVMCDHSNVTFAASSIIQYLGNTEDDIVINTLPLPKLRQELKTREQNGRPAPPPHIVKQHTIASYQKKYSNTI